MLKQRGILLQCVGEWGKQIRILTSVLVEEYQGNLAILPAVLRTFKSYGAVNYLVKGRWWTRAQSCQSLLSSQLYSALWQPGLDVHSFSCNPQQRAKATDHLSPPQLKLPTVAFYWVCIRPFSSPQLPVMAAFHTNTMLGCSEAP
jgi:hypothetical protein